ncbi:CPBP family intramembrane glutamic endopeptidase [Leuconostoc falkenbergense]|uniref:CPBP family intramembrane glutamic endopeptidase n=1 Tax=Leuconostoc falkenbergense TaxID=2766470 RepID=UPI0039ED15D2
MKKASLKIVFLNFMTPALIFLCFVWLMPLLNSFAISYLNYSSYQNYQGWLLSDITLYIIPIILLSLYLTNKIKKTIIWESPKLLSILLSLLVVVLDFVLTTVINKVFPIPVANNQRLILSTLNNSSILGIQLELLAITFLGPIFEELMCRGLLMNFYFRESKYGFDVIFSAIIFSLLHQHQNLTVLLPYFIFGLLLGLLYRFTGKLQYTMLAHIFVNTLIAWPYIQDNVIIFL